MSNDWNRGLDRQETERQQREVRQGLSRGIRQNHEAQEAQAEYARKLVMH